MLAGFIGLARPATAEQVVAESISLRQCIEQALRSSLELKIERITPKLEQWNVVRERGAFEPVVSSQLNWVRADDPLDPEQAAATHSTSLQQRRLTVTPSLGGRLPTGTGYELTANTTRFTGDLVTSNFLWTGTTMLTLTQPLLKNAGFGVNLAGLRIAHKNRDVARFGLARRAAEVVTDVGQAYYELVFAIENHKAAREDLQSAQKLLEGNQVLVKAGQLSPIEVTQAEAGVAARQEAVILADVLIKQRVNLLHLLLGRDVDPTGNTTLVPVDQPAIDVVDLDQPALIRTAMEMRPEYRQAQRAVEIQGLVVQYHRQQLWPQIDLKGTYGWTGRDHNFNGLADQITATEHPQWSVGTVVSLPLGNERARADYASAKLVKERALLQLKQQEQRIVVEVANAVASVRAGRERIAATQSSRRLAEEALRAEQKRLREGLSTSFTVLQSQTQLTVAQTAEIRARVSYQQALIGLDRATGTTLAKQGLVVDEN